jgi:uncharacterized membrane protein YkgB
MTWGAAPLSETRFPRIDRYLRAVESGQSEWNGDRAGTTWGNTTAAGRAGVPHVIDLGADLGGKLERGGGIVARYGLVVVLAWIGVGKYVKMESHVLIEHSPLMNWLYIFLSPTALAYSLATAEITAAVLIAIRPIWPRLSAAGSALAVVLFLGTVSLLFTSPGVVDTHIGALPVLAATPGQFLLKDLVLLGVALWTLGESLSAAGTGRPAAAVAVPSLRPGSERI